MASSSRPFCAEGAQAEHVLHATDVRNAWVDSELKRVEAEDRASGVWDLASSIDKSALADKTPDDSARPAKEEDFFELLGKRVVLHGLSARPELNESCGHCISWDAHAGRTGVRLDGKPKPISVKPSNLRLEAASGASVVADFCAVCAAEHQDEVCTPRRD